MKNAKDKLEDAKAQIGRMSRFVRDGDPVWYEAIPGTKYAAVVDGCPFELSEGQWVVRLRELDAAYTAMHPAKRTTVPAAGTWCIEPREVEGTTQAPRSMRFKQLRDGRDGARNEDAITLYQDHPNNRITLVDGDETVDLHAHNPHAGEVIYHLDPTQICELARFCISRVTSDDPATLIAQIRTLAGQVIVELEAWNDRARIDEEHPPYTKLVNLLRNIDTDAADIGKAFR